MPASAMITGLEGAVLTPLERSFLRTAEPAGLILFARNCETPEQVYRLIHEARDAIGREDTLVLVDQEGGRVQRLAPPTWRALPQADQFTRLLEETGEAEACAITAAVARLIAEDLTALGFNTNCAPVLDIPVAGAHDIIGSRAYGCDVETVVVLARAFADGLQAGGVLAVGKHIPGHGRARSDTHLELAIVDADRNELERTDFATFLQLASLQSMMTAHVVFSQIDDGEPASTSRRVHNEVIRGSIGFDGLLMSDDVSMQALDGPIVRRAERIIAAGSDLVLHCNGEFAEMEAIAGIVPLMTGRRLERLSAAAAVTRERAPFDVAEAEAACAWVLKYATAK